MRDGRDPGARRMADTALQRIAVLKVEKTDVGHTHTIGDVSGLQGALDGKANLVHGHAIADVTGLQAALDGKAATSHNHDAAYSPIGHTHSYLPLTGGTLSGVGPILAIDAVGADGRIAVLRDGVQQGGFSVDTGAIRLFGGWGTTLYLNAWNADRVKIDHTGTDIVSGVLKVDGTQVVGTQQPAIANHATDATVNAILAALRAHGLIQP